jgi:mRNA interferase MazF
MKDFDGWNKNKKLIDLFEDRLFFREGEIWWVFLGLNVGIEIDGRGSEFSRPVLVLKKYNQYSFLALPLTTSPQTNKYRIPIGIIAGKKAVANLSQLRNIDSKRLINKIGSIDFHLFKTVKEKAGQVNFG